VHGCFSYVFVLFALSIAFLASSRSLSAPTAFFSLLLPIWHLASTFPCIYSSALFRWFRWFPCLCYSLSSFFALLVPFKCPFRAPLFSVFEWGQALPLSIIEVVFFSDLVPFYDSFSFIACFTIISPPLRTAILLQSLVLSIPRHVRS
jgi:hypothetical protein